MATCPECGAKVRRDNLKAHVEKVHRKTDQATEEGAEETSITVRRRGMAERKVSPWPAVALAVVLAVSSVGAYWYLTRSPSSPGGGSPPPAANRRAVISTNYGTFTIELREDRAPRTTANFIGLANQGFYNGLTFHRVAHDFVIQGGDPNGDGSGGSGQTVAWEGTGLKNVKYSVAMARSGDPNSAQGANTATSQFFVNLVESPSLDNYAYPFVVFGQVISGQSVVDTIGRVPVDSNDKPISPVTMYSVTIVS